MDRPLGDKVPNFQTVPWPKGLHLKGQWADLRPLDAAQDGPALFKQFDGHDWLWDYLYEPAMTNSEALTDMLVALQAKDDKPCYVIRAKGDENPMGYACFWTTVPNMGSNEIGNVNLSPALQRTPIATDAFFLMLDWVFSNGYRRMEWKCNALNAPSRRAAQRLGFSFEGVFRNHLIVKGRNRDTAWFAITDADWVNLRPVYERWLDARNFDSKGVQKQSLADLMAPFLFQRDPTIK